VSTIFEFLTNPENLNWAFKKAQRLYRMADGVYDIAEVAAFELNLEKELRSIAKDFAELSYQLKPLVLLPQPKDERARRPANEAEFSHRGTRSSCLDSRSQRNWPVARLKDADLELRSSSL
jgi:hypothetical protein